MTLIKVSKTKNSTALAFALIPLSGFALDIFIPSLPAISTDMHATPAEVQLMLSIFLISLGICQLLIGSVLDSFGRYRPAMIGLALFSLSSFGIATAHSMEMIYAMRALQGFCVATIIVGKRAVFIDLYSGELLKKYTSMFSVVWAAAPVIAPFIGGFLQVHFGWRSNFYFLGLLGLIFLILELMLDGETLKVRHPFRLKAITTAYSSMIKTKDFSVGIIILGLLYAMIMVYGMTSPFLIEKLMHYSPAVTGNASLVSGLGVMAGGMLSRRLIGKTFFTKIFTGIMLMEAVALVTTGVAFQSASIFTILAFVITLHFGAGFIFNSVFSYVLTRFTHMGGKAGGLAGGGYIIITSAVSQGVVSFFPARTQVQLGFVYAILILMVFLFFVTTKWIAESTREIRKHQIVPIVE
jgi:DHA1 family bicyclomycin/chloramphenicol resistance-like MFS transporter